MAEFVDFIEHDQRIFGPCPANGLNDSARHSSYICAPVATKFRFVMHATKAEPIKLTIQGPGD